MAKVKIVTRRQRNKRGISRNVRPALLMMLLPVIGGLGVLVFFLAGFYSESLAAIGSKRLETPNWQVAEQSFKTHEPNYERKFAYYQLKEGQNLAKVSAFFSVPEAKLTELNPGDLIGGTTIKLPPVEQPLQPTAGPNGKIATARIIDDKGLLRIRQDYKLDEAVTNLPELMQFLRSYNAIEEVAPKVFRINRPISLEDNIRLDITSATVSKLELRSAPNDVTCLCLDGAGALVQDVEITSFDPTTGQVDKTHEDQRAFIRTKSGRMDILNTKITYLGNGLMQYADETKKPTHQKEGGTYGISWRIPDDMLGVETVTGWVENTTFARNHFGAYTYGASGMTWRNNLFVENDVYGLDPHDDSNNALVENNVFERNGKHGFIVSKRCNYNIIRNNTSFGNKLHGFMLHQDSSFNLMENNVAYDNTDNFVIYASDYNMVRGNISYGARLSHVRINEKAKNNYVVNNELLGGRRGIYLYGGVANTLVSGNKVYTNNEILATNTATTTLFASNTIGRLGFVIAPQDKVIFGANTVKEQKVNVPGAPSLPGGYTAKNWQ